MEEIWTFELLKDADAVELFLDPKSSPDSFSIEAFEFLRKTLAEELLPMVDFQEFVRLCRAWAAARKVKEGAAVLRLDELAGSLAAEEGSAERAVKEYVGQLQSETIYLLKAFVKVNRLLAGDVRAGN